MPKMKFNTRVKYKEAYHPALEPLEVDEADVPELQQKGGVLLEELEKDAPKPSEETQKRGKDKGRRG